MSVQNRNSKRVCAFCESEEGKLRLVGNFIVELSEMDYRGDQKLACQSCRVKHRNMDLLKQRIKKSELSKMGWIQKIIHRKKLILMQV